jgi:hypothetical protein
MSFTIQMVNWLKDINSFINKVFILIQVDSFTRLFDDAGIILLPRHPRCIEDAN